MATTSENLNKHLKLALERHEELSTRAIYTIKGETFDLVDKITMPCVVLGQPLLLGLSRAHTIIGLGLSASVGGIVSCLFLVGACSGFYRFSSVANCSWPFCWGPTCCQG